MPWFLGVAVAGFLLCLARNWERIRQKLYAWLVPM